MGGDFLRSMIVFRLYRTGKSGQAGWFTISANSSLTALAISRPA